MQKRPILVKRIITQIAVDLANIVTLNVPVKARTTKIWWLIWHKICGRLREATPSGPRPCVAYAVDQALLECLIFHVHRLCVSEIEISHLHVKAEKEENQLVFLYIYIYIYILFYSPITALHVVGYSKDDQANGNKGAGDRHNNYRELRLSLSYFNQDATTLIS